MTVAVSVCWQLIEYDEKLRSQIRDSRRADPEIISACIQSRTASQVSPIGRQSARQVDLDSDEFLSLRHSSDRGNINFLSGRV